jgi:hypothetical protein
MKGKIFMVFCFTFLILAMFYIILVGMGTRQMEIRTDKMIMYQRNNGCVPHMEPNFLERLADTITFSMPFNDRLNQPNWCK